MPKDNKPIHLNGAFYVGANILKLAVASAAEAKVGALNHNCQKGIVFCKILSDMGHLQPKNLVHCGNANAVGMANNTVKWQRFCSMGSNENILGK
jgi:hypothetical protein